MIDTAFHIQTVNNLHGPPRGLHAPLLRLRHQEPGNAAWLVASLAGTGEDQHATWRRLLAA
jgi:hypothetical protein